MKRICSIALLVLAGLSSASCSRTQETTSTAPPPEAPAPASPSAQPVAVVGVTLGREVGADKRVIAALDAFAPTDTIYASVDTQGAASTATMSARWTFEDGQTVHEESQTIAPSGPATTEFHVSKPDGWPKGGYRVEILLDGVPVKTATFQVA